MKKPMENGENSTIAISAVAARSRAYCVQYLCGVRAVRKRRGSLIESSLVVSWDWNQEYIISASSDFDALYAGKKMISLSSLDNNRPTLRRRNSQVLQCRSAARRFAGQMAFRSLPQLQLIAYPCARPSRPRVVTSIEDKLETGLGILPNSCRD